MKNASRIAVALIAAAPLFSAFAQSTTPTTPVTPGIDTHGNVQDQRIQQQTASGNLNQYEANRMQRHGKILDRAEQNAAADGVVTAEERAKLRHAQRRQSRSIYRQSHD